jgi:hypothetical protein
MQKVHFAGYCPHALVFVIDAVIKKYTAVAALIRKAEKGRQKR